MNSDLHQDFSRSILRAQANPSDTLIQATANLILQKNMLLQGDQSTPLHQSTVQTLLANLGGHSIQPS